MTESGAAARTGTTLPPAPPLIFIDVDGTLLPFSAMHDSPVFSRMDRRHGPRLLALGGELWWATAWMNDANDTIAPLLGLPSLPVVDLPAWEDDFVDDPLCWKTRTVVAHAAGRPFVWIDDEPTARDERYVAAHHPGPALLHSTDPHVGLTDADFEVIAAWLRAHGLGRVPTQGGADTGPGATAGSGTGIGAEITA